MGHGIVHLGFDKSIVMDTNFYFILLWLLYTFSPIAEMPRQFGRKQEKPFNAVLLQSDFPFLSQISFL